MTSRSDLTTPPDLTHGRPLQPLRARQPVYLDLLAPCNVACPAGEDIQGWLALAQAGRLEEAWRHLVRDNPCPRCTDASATTRASRAATAPSSTEAVSIHAVERFLGDRAIAEG